MHLPTELYKQKVANNILTSDSSQKNILPLLDKLTQQLNTHVKLSTINNINTWQETSKTPPKGIFICGDVGRGKSMLMQLFFDCVEIKEKRRVHFHPFMEEIHERIHNSESKDGTDIVLQIASDIAKTARLLCFDEFYVTNIGDAVLLGRLLDALFKCGVVLCATSNWKIEQLYQDGYNYSLFQPFIEIIQKHMQEVILNSEIDWRRKNIANTEGSLAVIANNNHICKNNSINLLETIIPLDYYKDGILVVKFKDICDIYIGRERYLILAKKIKGIVITGIPYLDKEKSAAAMRFVILVDLLYEYNVPLIVSTLNKTDNIETICEDGPVAFAFQRTISRLAELGQL